MLKDLIKYWCIIFHTTYGFIINFMITFIKHYQLLACFSDAAVYDLDYFFIPNNFHKMTKKIKFLKKLIFIHKSLLCGLTALLYMHWLAVGFCILLYFFWGGEGQLFLRLLFLGLVFYSFSYEYFYYTLIRMGLRDIYFSLNI